MNFVSDILKAIEHFSEVNKKIIKIRNYRIPAIFVIFYLQDANKKLIFKKKFFCLLQLFKFFIIFQKLKKSQNSRNQGFSYFFLLDDRRIRIRISD